MDALDYQTFLARKSQVVGDDGFEPRYMPAAAFDFQRELIAWSARKGRSEIMAECGLGKTLIELGWAKNVVRHTRGNVLIVAPLAVSQQTQREAEKFNIEARVSRDGSVPCRLTVTNYERLHYFNPEDFVGAVADEASAIKAFDGKRRKQVTRFFSKLPYRLLATATPAPNDFIELGTASECLGIMTQSDMLGYFFRETKDMRHTVFREHDFWNDTKWTFKPHSERPFWRWVASWGRALSRPSDIGAFDDAKYVLPPLKYHYHVIQNPYIPAGELFPRPAITLNEQKDERQRTIKERCAKVAELVAHDRPAIVWCHLNDEGDLLEKLIPGCVQVAGKDPLEEKEAKLWDFASGNVRVLVTKPRIGCWGLNLQHCGDQTFFPSHSFEQFYQGVRRCWRFGRTEPVNVHIVSAEGESKVIHGLERKLTQSQHMFASIVAHMNAAAAMNSSDQHKYQVTVPDWLSQPAMEAVCQ